MNTKDSDFTGEHGQNGGSSKGSVSAGVEYGLNEASNIMDSPKVMGMETQAGEAQKPEQPKRIGVKKGGKSFDIC